jgi:hypothetical protein
VNTLHKGDDDDDDDDKAVFDLVPRIGMRRATAQFSYLDPCMRAEQGGYLPVEDIA